MKGTTSQAAEKLMLCIRARLWSGRKRGPDDGFSRWVRLFDTVSATKNRWLLKAEDAALLLVLTQILQPVILSIVYGPTKFVPRSRSFRSL
jgi:hypothetical protein